MDERIKPFLNLFVKIWRLVLGMLARFVIILAIILVANFVTSWILSLVVILFIGGFLYLMVRIKLLSLVSFDTVWIIGMLLLYTFVVFFNKSTGI